MFVCLNGRSQACRIYHFFTLLAKANTFGVGILKVRFHALADIVFVRELSVLVWAIKALLCTKSCHLHQTLLLRHEVEVVPGLSILAALLESLKLARLCYHNSLRSSSHRWIIYDKE